MNSHTNFSISLIYQSMHIFRQVCKINTHTSLGLFILPTTKTSSRAGCQAALNGVNHLPVWLLWLKEMLIQRSFELHLFLIKMYNSLNILWYVRCLMKTIQTSHEQNFDKNSNIGQDLLKFLFITLGKNILKLAWSSLQEIFW